MRTQNGGNIWAAVNTGKVVWIAKDLYEVKVGGEVLQQYSTALLCCVPESHPAHYFCGDALRRGRVAALVAGFLRNETNT